jgi:hypothetical protein
LESTVRRLRDLVYEARTRKSDQDEAHDGQENERHKRHSAS